MDVKDKIATAFANLRSAEADLVKAHHAVDRATQDIEKAKSGIAKVLKATGHTEDSIIHQGRIYHLSDDRLVIQKLQATVSVIADDDSIVTIKPEGVKE